MHDQLGRCLQDLRISVTDKCNFRCRYCMPIQFFHKKSFIQYNKLLNFDEIIRIVYILYELGLRKVRLTGGEPLIRKNISKLIMNIRKISIKIDIALTTNGYFLKNNIIDLKKSGLNRITISLDSLNNNMFKHMTNTNIHVRHILLAIRMANKLNFNPIKINVLIQNINNNIKNIIDLIQFSLKSKNIVRFIEYMDVGTINKWKKNNVINNNNILNTIKKKFWIIEKNKKKDDVSTQYYAIDLKKNNYCELGVISSISKPFCDHCSRIRLSIRGLLYTCLFSISGIKFINNNNNILKKNVLNLWKNRKSQYSQNRSKYLKYKINNKKIEMFYIGG